MMITHADTRTIARLHDGFELLGDEDTEYHEATEGRGALVWAVGSIFLALVAIAGWLV